MKYIELQSKVFDFLRFPLIVGVVIIHTFSFNDVCGGQVADYQGFYFCQELFSDVLARVAVPIFFLMSGYLFFYNVEFSKKVYLRKLKSRCRSLLIPYIIWNFLSFLMMFLTSKIAPSFVNHPPELSLQYIASSFWALARDGSNIYPMSFQFWFIRDLMVIVVLTPLLYCLIKYTRNIAVVAFGICFILKKEIPIIGFSTTGWFFFSLGACMSINKKNVVQLVKRLGSWVYLLYLALVVMDIVLGISYIREIGIIIGLICWVKFATYLIEVKDVKQKPILASSSFFIFAIHQPFILPVVGKLIMRFVNPSSDLALIISYFGIAAFVVFLGLGFYYLLRKIMPQFTTVLTGGRV